MIYLMRHGQDDETFIGGWSNAPLTKEGIIKTREQALWIKENLKITQILTSDIKRAVITASIMNEILNIPYETTSMLREQNKGLLNGLLKEEAERLYPKYFTDLTINTVYPEGESLKMLYTRITQNLSLLEKLPASTLLITHRGVINMIYYHLNNIELSLNKEQFKVKPSSIHELDLSRKQIRRIR